MKKKKTQGRGKKKILTLKTERATTKKGGERVRVIPEILSCRKKKKKQTNKQTKKINN